MDSDDVIGASAESFNRLIYALTRSHDVESRVAAFTQAMSSQLELGPLCEGAMTALLPSARHIPFWHLYNCVNNGAGLDEINREFDICVFTCANLLRKGLSADAEALVLSKLDMPVVMPAPPSSG